MSTNENQALVLPPPSSTKTVPLIVPSLSPARSGVMVRKSYDKNGEQRLEIVSKRKKEKKAEGRVLSKGLVRGGYAGDTQRRFLATRARYCQTLLIG